jgi:hypothetical protein
MPISIHYEDYGLIKFTLNEDILLLNIDGEIINIYKQENIYVIKSDNYEKRLNSLELVNFLKNSKTIKFLRLDEY